MHEFPLTGKAHAKYSASGSERWLNCAGSIKLSMGVPPAPDSKYAAEGTRAHECLEMLMKNPHQTLSASAMLRQKYGIQMVTHAQSAYRDITAMRPKGADLLAETRVSLEFVAPDMFGTADAVVAEHFGVLRVIDYKYGAGIPVDPDSSDGFGNSQLAYYALGVAHRFDYNFQKVELVIIQPRALHARGPVRSFSLSMTKLETWTERFRNGVQACEKKNPELKAGKWCRFCPAKSICPETDNATLRDAQADFAD